MSITAYSTVDHLITLSQAIDLTTAYRANAESLLKSNYQGMATLSNSETFNREIFDDLLAQEGCQGIRIYSGMDTNSKVHVVIVAVTASNEDILDVAPTSSQRDPIIIENGIRCPEECPPASDLNS